MRKAFFAVLAVLAFSAAYAQQDQTSDVSRTEHIVSENARWVQGVAPGYWATCTNRGSIAQCSGLTLYLTAGTVWCQGTIQTYAGGTLTMTNNATNYVYLDPTSSCAPAVSTSVFSSSQVPIAVIVASGGVITTITDDRGALAAYTSSSGGGNGIKVNGTAIAGTNGNFNGTSPSAGSNNLNVTFQADSSTPNTNISAEVPAATNSTLGLVMAFLCSSHNWLSTIATGTGVPSCTQPGFSDLSGNISTSQMNSGTGASSSTFWRGDGTWSSPGTAGPGANTNYRYYCNNGTGTGSNLISRLNGNCAQTVATADSATTTRPLGICTGNCTTSGAARITYQGPAACVFDNGTTEEDSVVWSTTSGHNGQCHDTGGIDNVSVGGSPPCIGSVESTNASAGTYIVDLGYCGAFDNASGFSFDSIAVRPIWGSIPLPTYMELTGPNIASQQLHFLEGMHACWDPTGGGAGGLGCIWAIGSGTGKGLHIAPDFSGNGYSLDIAGGEYSAVNNLGTQSGGFTCDLSLGMICEATASGGNPTVNVSNLNAGQMFFLHLCEDATGGHTWSWQSTFINPPSPSTAANSCTAPTGSPITFLFNAVDATHIFTVSSF